MAHLFDAKLLEEKAYGEIDSPRLMSAFLNTTKLYLAYLRCFDRAGKSLDPGHPNADGPHVHQLSRAFVNMAGKPHVWPVVQARFGEFRYPLYVYCIEHDGPG